jgi:hypothetical protein
MEGLKDYTFLPVLGTCPLCSSPLVRDRGVTQCIRMGCFDDSLGLAVEVQAESGYSLPPIPEPVTSTQALTAAAT